MALYCRAHYLVRRKLNSVIYKTDGLYEEVILIGRKMFPAGETDIGKMRSQETKAFFNAPFELHFLRLVPCRLVWMVYAHHFSHSRPSLPEIIPSLEIRFDLLLVSYVQCLLSRSEGNGLLHENICAQFVFRTSFRRIIVLLCCGSPRRHSFDRMMRLRFLHRTDDGLPLQPGLPSKIFYPVIF